MTELEQRIERAARAALAGEGLNRIGWDDLTEQDCDAYREQAREIIRAFAPELFTDPPRAWLAPWVIPRLREGPFLLSEWWNEMRDAHLRQPPPNDDPQPE